MFESLSKIWVIWVPFILSLVCHHDIVGVSKIHCFVIAVVVRYEINESPSAFPSCAVTLSFLHNLLLLYSSFLT